MGAVSLNSPSVQTAPPSSSHSPGPSSLPMLGKHLLGRPRYSRVKSTPPSHLGWEEEKTRTYTFARQARFMRRLYSPSSTPKPRLPSLEYHPSPAPTRTSSSTLPIAPHRSLTRLKLIARGSHLTESTSTFPTTTRAPAQRFMSNGPTTMALPSTE